MSRQATSLAILIMLVLFAAASVSARTWTDTTGKYSIDGEFIKLADGTVSIRQDDGKLIRIPLEKLSDSDQEFVRQQTHPMTDETPFAVAEEELKTAASSGGAGESRDLQTVVAEGIGTTSNGALKDAFRAAVQQVVGTVVDAETLVKNDDLVRDQVLTYSDAFIPKHKKITERKEEGLVRVRIRATVQRRSLIMKLKAANISVKEVDGQSMFGRIASELSAEADALALVRKDLEGFPLNCLEARVTGEPKMLEKKGTEAQIALTVRYEANLQAYEAFVNKLEKTLEAVAKQHGEFSMVAQNDSPVVFVPEMYHSKRTVLKKWIPVLADMDSKQSVVVAVNTLVNSRGNRTEWKYYVVDAAVREPLAATAACLFPTKLSLLDDRGGVIAVDRFLSVDTVQGRDVVCSGEYPATLILAGYASGEDAWAFKFFAQSDPREGGREGVGFCRKYYEHLVRDEQIFLIAPLFFDNHQRSVDLQYRRFLTVSRKLTLSLEEIRAVRNVQCELTFDRSLPPDVNSQNK